MSIAGHGLVERAAERLAGRPVSVRMRAPYIQGVGGIALKTREGKAIIDINPEVSEELMLRLLCHECSHILLEWDEMRADDSASLEPNSYKFQPGVREHLVEGESEQGAERMARKMFEFAARNASKYHASSELERRLLALCDWNYFDALIESAVNKAIQRVKSERGLR